MRLFVAPPTIALWLSASVFFWWSAPHTPRDGWSLARVWTGIVGPSPSGDRAFHIHGVPVELLRNKAGGVTAEPADASSRWIQAEPRIRLLRRGLFRPWLESEDLMIVPLRGGSRVWTTGTPDPDWVGMLSAIRARYTAHPSERSDLLANAIGRELSGAYPLHRVRVGPLLTESIAVLVHVLLMASVTRGLWLLWVSERASRRAADGLCVCCGYDVSGAAGACPECGTAPAGPSITRSTHSA